MQRYDFSKRLKIILLTAGYGKRWQPLSFIIPKCCIPFLNYPFIEIILSYLKKFNATDIYINLFHLGNRIKEFLQNHEKLFNFYYSEEPFLLGTAGAVKRIFDLYNESEALVMNTDSFLPLAYNNFYKFHIRNKSDLTLCLKRETSPSFYTPIFLNKEKKISFNEEDSLGARAYNFCGVYILKPLSISHIERGKYEDFAEDILKLPSLNLRIIGYICNRLWLDIGTPHAYLNSTKKALRAIISSRITPQWLPDNFIRKNKVLKLKNGILLCKETTKILTDKIKGFAVIGDNCYIGRDSILIDTVIMDNSIVADKAIVKNCIIGPSVKINSLSHYENKMILSFAALRNAKLSFLYKAEDNIIKEII